ncbi:MAG: Ig-like domain-containing protein [Rhodothermales bacterium]
MKRLLSLLALVFLGFIIGLPAAFAQQKAPSSTNQLLLTLNPDTAFTFVDTPIDIDVMANDVETNVGKAIVLIDVATQPRNGAATVERNGTPVDASDDFVRYTPGPGFIGKDSLRYIAESVFTSNAPKSAASTADTAWVFIFINRVPVGEDDAFQVLPNETTNLDVLDNDTDADDDALRVESIETAPENGTADILAQTVIAYTPDADFTGADSLEYVVFDGKNGRDTVQVNITVNTPPVAVNDSTTTQPGKELNVDVLANDSDPEGGPLTIGGISMGPANGTAMINGNVISYTPQAGFAGSDTFDYVAADQLGGVDTASVFVQVNTPPVAEDDTVETPFETPSDFDVLTNDTDADGNPLTITAVSPAPAHGTAEIINSGKAIRYTPDADFFGLDTFDYTIADGIGGEDQATVTVAVVAESPVQFIHNALEADPVDVYVNGTRLLDDFAFRTATPFLDLDSGPAQVDVTLGNAPDNSAPLFSTALDLAPSEAYIVIAQGIAGEDFTLLVKDNARVVASNAQDAEHLITNGVPDSPGSGIDIRVLDPTANNLPTFLLANNLRFGEIKGYLILEPGILNIDATDFTNDTLYDAYRFDWSALVGKTFTLLASGRLNPISDEEAFTLIAFDADGNALVPDVVTATEETEELPTEFALHGNYPNPFNPTTTIRFDLPETAEVRLDVVDMLGRRVMTVPVQRVEAGANRALEVDASRLASGTYLYRLIIRTATDTMAKNGRMMLIK